MPKSNFAEHRKNRAAGLRSAAIKAAANSDAAMKRSDEMASVIQMGQPILIGHYSEGRDRRYRDRMNNLMRKSLDLKDKAFDLSDRAQVCEDNTAIFSDDPEATEKLTEKIDRLEARQNLMKAANKLARKKDTAGLFALGFGPGRVVELIDEGGFRSWELTNNNANLRTAKQRLAYLNKHASDVTSEVEIGDVTIKDNVEENRVQIFFPGRPSDNTRDSLSRHGFHWSPSLGCWQRMRSDWAMRIAVDLVKTHCS